MTVLTDGLLYRSQDDNKVFISGTRCLQGIHGEGWVAERVRLSFSLVVRTAF